MVVWAVPDEDDPLARRVVIIEPAACRQVLGTIIIVDTAGKTITVAPADGGDDVILSYGGGTRFVLRGSISLEVGEQVRAVYDEEGMAKLVIVVGADLD